MTALHPASASRSSPWGHFELPPQGRARIECGPLTLWVERKPKEWHLAHARNRDAPGNQGGFELGVEPAPGDAEQVRFAAGSTNASLCARPALADRPIVIRPEQPFALFAGDEAVFYFGSPLWLELTAGDPPRPLLELPCVRPSDTWFGPSTREGELCYAAQTRARMDLEAIDWGPARALTRVRLINSSAQTLHFTRLLVPIGRLGLFLAADGRHWTEGLRANVGTEVVDCEVETAPPEEAGSVERVREARRGSSGGFRRALVALVG